MHKVSQNEFGLYDGQHEAIVTEEVNNLNATGHVMIDGLPWTARAASEEEIIPVGEEVVVESIEGVKCIVKRK